ACRCILVGVAKSVRNDDPLAIAAATAIRTGDLATLERMLAENPDLANVQIEGRKGGYRTPLHVVADWPGYFPNGPAVVRLLLANGADLNWVPDYAKGTPLDQAGSSDTGRAALVSWPQERGARSARG